MLKVGDTVKVIAPTMYNGKATDLYPIGTIVTVTEVEHGEDGKIFCEVQSQFPHDHYGWWYRENELEKGHLEWVKD